MTLGEFRTLFRLMVPGASIQKITNAHLDTLFNKAVVEVNLAEEVYKEEVLFDVTAEQQTYNISENSKLQLKMLGFTKEGLKWNNGTRWVDLWPTTKQYLYNTIPDWRNESSGDPKWYWHEFDEIGLHPKPDTTLTNGFRAHVLRKPESMDTASKYPWANTTTELLALRPMDDAILAYVRWKISPAIGKNQTGVVNEKEYRKEVRRGGMQSRRRPDLVQHKTRGNLKVAI